MSINKIIWGKRFGKQLLKTMWILENPVLKNISVKMLVRLFENHIFLRLVDKSTRVNKIV